MAELKKSCHFAVQGAVTHVFSSFLIEDMISGKVPIVTSVDSLEEVDFIREIVRDWYNLRLGSDSKFIIL